MAQLHVIDERYHTLTDEELMQADGGVLPIVAWAIAHPVLATVGAVGGTYAIGAVFFGNRP